MPGGAPTQDVPPLYGQVKAGSVALSAATSVAVTFSSAMPSTSYQVVLTLLANLATGAMWVSNLTVNGFTLNVGLAVTGSIGWIAVPNQ